MSQSRLISYIAPSAPATRRPTQADEAFLRPEVGFTPRWFHDALGTDFGMRWHTDVGYRRETVMAMRKELRRRFPETHIGRIDQPESSLDLLTGVYGTCTVAAIFGLPIVYAKDNWPDVTRRYLTRERMALTESPDLDTNPAFQDILRQVDEIQAIEGRVAGFINWQGVLNNAQRLRGQDLFLDLYETPELCHRFFDIICEVMIEAIHCLQERQRDGGVDYRFATVSNCSVNMISPSQYEEFFLPRDRRIADAFETLGIHNCAWNADPYLLSYATIPNLGYIDMGIGSNLERARALMPQARRALMYTPMDLANKTPDDIRTDLERIAKEYGPCDIVLGDIESGTPDDRVLYFIEECSKLSGQHSI
jgi:uroporphyrinogen-III decarboxylase